MSRKYSLRRLLFENKIDMEKVNSIDGKSELHVFDFDDTIAVTPNANGIMPMRNGKPIFSVQADKAKFENFLSAYYGLVPEDFAPPAEGEETIQWNEEQQSWTAYVLSHALNKVQRKHPKLKREDGAEEKRQFVWGWDKFSPPSTDEIRGRRPDDPAGSEGLDLSNISSLQDDDTMQVGIDFSPSNSTSAGVTAVDTTIDRMKDANTGGANTKIMTARGGEGNMYARFSGTKKVPVTNAEDMFNYAKNKGAEPTMGADGVWGQDKGKQIQNLMDEFPESDKPTEIHFYDDQDANIENVKNAFANDPDNDLFLYGPGNFHTGEKGANAMRPTSYYPGANVPQEGETEEEVEAEEQLNMERWQRIAGLLK